MSVNLYQFPDLGQDAVQSRLKRVERTVQFPKRGIVADSGANFRTVAAWQVDRDGNIVVGDTAVKDSSAPGIVQKIIAPDPGSNSGWREVNALLIGGYDDKAGVLKVRSERGDVIGYIGGFAGGDYGAWFKTVGIGGADQNNPNLYVDSFGNIHMYGGTILGLSGLAVDSDGNVHLKNILQVLGTTANPSIGSSFADLPELGSGNAAMTVTTHGNPCLIGVNLSFISQTAGGGTVDSIAVLSGGSFAAGVTPAVTISGDGSGALAHANMVAIGGGRYGVDTVDVDNTGSGYTFAMVSFSPTGGSGLTGARAAASVTAPTVYSGVPIGVQVLQDGIPILGPATVTTDISGRVNYAATTIAVPSSASHNYQVQSAIISGLDPVQSTSRAFQILELG